MSHPIGNTSNEIYATRGTQHAIPNTSNHMYKICNNKDMYKSNHTTPPHHHTTTPPLTSNDM